MPGIAPPAERERRSFDEPAHHSFSELDAKALQLVKVDCIAIEPSDLHNFLLAGGAMPGIEGLIHQVESIVLPCFIAGCAGGAVLD